MLLLGVGGECGGGGVRGQSGEQPNFSELTLDNVRNVLYIFQGTSQHTMFVVYSHTQGI